VAAASVLVFERARFSPHLVLLVHGVACGLQDFEMAIIEHYYEALGVMSELFTYIFDGIADRYKVTLPLPTSHPPTSFSLVYREGAKGTDICSCSVPPCTLLHLLIHLPPHYSSHAAPPW
jgi:hypothetical protein